jgi:hypothetical protein
MLRGAAFRWFVPVRSVVTATGAVALAAASAMLPASGCASAPPMVANAAVDPAGRVPSDLWLEVVVRPGRGVADHARVEERPARFVLLPDGTLHGETDRLPPAGARPARVRRLAREQMADVWNALVSAGFSGARSADDFGNVALLTPNAGELARLEGKAIGAGVFILRKDVLDCVLLSEAAPLSAEVPVLATVEGLGSPRRCGGQGDVLAGRIRKDLSDPSGKSISMFVAADQLLKGAALNAVQIAELL